VLTLTEAAARLGVAASTLRHQVQVGRLQARLIGKTYVVTEREVERYRATSLGRATGQLIDVGDLLKARVGEEGVPGRDRSVLGAGGPSG
jgi:excisionase family DNA binding protein